MTLLELARGPGLTFALAVFVLGTLWRLVGVLRLPRLRDLSPAREAVPSALIAVVRANLRAMWPRPAYAPFTLWVTINGYVFHIGLALVFFGYAPHISFIRRILGFGWPALPDIVMVVAASATLIAMLMALATRLTDPVRKKISSADDFISWTVTFLPLFTGMAVMGEPSAAILARSHVVYGGPLAMHLLSLELLLVWFPFGKLMHALLFAFSRGATGLRFSHRGVEA